MCELALTSAEATEAVGAALAVAIREAGGGACIFLRGELGAGKTTFARGFLSGLGHRDRVPSPTYTLVEPYELNGQRIWHLDLYRLGDAGELEFLGLDDMVEPEAVLLIEWPERGGDFLPTEDLLIELKVIPEGRLMRLSAGTATGRGALARFVPPATEGAEAI